MGYQAQLLYYRIVGWLILIAFPICLVLFAFSDCSLRKRSEKAACREGDVAQCMYVGKYYDDKQGGIIAFMMSYADDSLRYYFEACKLRESHGCERMLYILAHGEQAKNLSVDEGAIADALIANCADDVPDTCAQLWGFMSDTDWAQNRSRIAFDRRCTAGDAKACALLDRMRNDRLGGLQPQGSGDH